MDKYLAKIKQGEKFEGYLTAPRNSQTRPITLRALLVKGMPSIQITELEGNKAIHKNVSPFEGCETLIRLLPLYKRVQLIFPNETVEWVANRRGEWIKQGVNETKKQLVFSHNRTKQHPLPEGTPIPFLIHLGVMKADGKVVPAKYDKFRQINRFLELVEDVIKKLPKKQKMSIIDFGCGKAYLTFALYYWLCEHHRQDVEILGLDLKVDVVEFCEQTARALGFEGLHFQIGRIEETSPKGNVDLVVTLHACDTATDAALEKAIKWKAQAILSVPCCQHELFNQVKCDVLKPLLKHGLLKERFAALITDAARAELLEIEGYDVDIVEFVDPEHTPKNLMIRAVKRDQKRSSEDYIQFTKFLSVSPQLGKMTNNGDFGNPNFHKGKVDLKSDR